VARAGLRATIRRTVMLALPREKLAMMSPDIRRREEGRTIHTIGAYTFARMCILDIGGARRMGR
jgi:hypothetical protein